MEDFLLVAAASRGSACGPSLLASVLRRVDREAADDRTHRLVPLARLRDGTAFLVHDCDAGLSSPTGTLMVLARACRLLSVAPLLHLLHVKQLTLGGLARLLLELHFLEEVVCLSMLLLDGVMTLGLLLVARRRHARAKVAGSPCAVALSHSEHVLHLEVFQVRFDNGLGLLLLVTGSQALVEQVLGVLARASRLVLCQAEHGAGADALRHAQLLGL